MDTVYKVAFNQMTPNPVRIIYDDIIEKAVKEIKPKIESLLNNEFNSRWLALKIIDGDTNILNSINSRLGFNLMEKLSPNKLELMDNNKNSLRDRMVACIIAQGEKICSEALWFERDNYHEFDRKVDNILTSKLFGIPIMVALLGVIFWITIEGANIPSKIIANFLFWIEDRITGFLPSIIYLVTFTGH